VNLGRYELLLSLARLGLAHVPDGRLIEIAVTAGNAMLGDQDFCADIISRGDGKGDLISDRGTRSQKAG